MDVLLIHPVRHDGIKYQSNTVLSLTKKQADRLKRLGVAVDATNKQEEQEEEQIHHELNNKNSWTEEKQEAQEPSQTKSNEELEVEEEEEEINLDHVIDLADPEEMTREELEAELTAGGVDFPSSISNKALMARVKRLREQE